MVSFISISSTLGIAVGVAVIIIGLSAMNGFERELQNRVLAVIPHGELEAVKPPFTEWTSVLDTVQEHPQVTAAAPYIRFTALLEKGSSLKAVEVRGVNPQEERKVSAIPDYVKGNAWQSFSAGKKQVILGQGVADKLGITEGDWITAMIPNPDPSLKLKAPHRIRLQVSGLLALGGQIDHNFALVPLADAQQYLSMGDGVSGISLNVENVLDAQTIVREVGFTLPVYVYLKSWTQKYGYFIPGYPDGTYHYVSGDGAGDWRGMLQHYFDPDDGGKRSLGRYCHITHHGSRRRASEGYFYLARYFVGVVGSLLGAMLGSLVAVNLTLLIKGLENIIGHQFLSGDIYFVDFLPTELAWQDVAIVSLTAIVLSLLATWYPARRASALQPAQVLSAK